MIELKTTERRQTNDSKDIQDNSELPLVIFLDFDGVLCTLRQSFAEGDLGLLGCLDPVAIKFLDRMCYKYNIKIVISSTWRIGKDYSHFHSLFKAAGAYKLANSLHQDFKTVSECGFRGNDIEKWLAKNEVLDYIILDDESDFHEYQKERLVKTSMNDGMLLDNYVDIIERLEKLYGHD